MSTHEFLTVVTLVLTVILLLVALVEVLVVRHDVKTKNSKTIGELASEGETRRIVRKPAWERTMADRKHLRDVPPEVPEGHGGD